MFVCLPVYCMSQGAWAQIGGGGGTGGRVPPRFFRWGTQYQMSPPRFLGRMNFGRYNVIFFFKLFWRISFFFFFLLVRNVRDVGWVPLHILTCATFHADGAPEKKVSESPPPPTFGAGGGRQNVSVPPPPHNPLFAPLSGSMYFLFFFLRKTTLLFRVLI